MSDTDTLTLADPESEFKVEHLPDGSVRVWSSEFNLVTKRDACNSVIVCRDKDLTLGPPDPAYPEDGVRREGA